MKTLQYLEQQRQLLDATKEKSILTAKNEHLERLQMLSEEKRTQDLQNKRNYDHEILSIETKYPVAATWLAYQELEKKKNIDKDCAKVIYNLRKSSIEDEYNKNCAESTLALHQMFEKIEHEYQQHIVAQKKLYESEMEQMRIECANEKKVYWDKQQEITREYQSKSKKLHQGATKTHNTLIAQLSELQSSSIYLESYILFAKLIGLNGITDDVGTYVSKDYVYNNVLPLITYPELYSALKNQYKNEVLSQLVIDFYTPPSDSSVELNQLLKSLDLKESDELSNEHMAYYNSSWYKNFYKLIQSKPEFRNHIYGVMAKHNQRLAQKHGWESMPLTKIHLCNSSPIHESPFNQTPWSIISKENSQMRSVICSAYYEREKKLKTEHDIALKEAKDIFESKLEYAQDRMIERLKQAQNTCQADLKAHIIDEPTIKIEKISTPAVIQKNQEPPKAQHYQRLFTKPIDRTIYTIHENVEIDEIDEDIEINEDDPEICSILANLSIF